MFLNQNYFLCQRVFFIFYLKIFSLLKMNKSVAVITRFLTGNSFSQFGTVLTGNKKKSRKILTF